MRTIDRDDILKRNRHIDPKRVARFEAFCRTAEAAGLEVRPHYRLSPPLGDARANQARPFFELRALSNK